VSPSANAAATVARQLGLPAEPRRAPAPARPPLRVVEPRTAPRRRLRPGRVGTIAGVLLFAALFAVAAFQTVLIKGQADLDALDDRLAAEEVRHRDLALTVAELQSPDRITTAAKERLGMIEPAGVVFLRPDAGAAAPSPDAGSPEDASTSPSGGR
jgi:cell division protein FtsB